MKKKSGDSSQLSVFIAWFGMTLRTESGSYSEFGSTHLIDQQEPIPWWIITCGGLWGTVWWFGFRYYPSTCITVCVTLIAVGQGFWDLTRSIYAHSPETRLVPGLGLDGWRSWNILCRHCEFFSMFLLNSPFGGIDGVSEPSLTRVLLKISISGEALDKSPSCILGFFFAMKYREIVPLSRCGTPVNSFLLPLEIPRPSF